MKHNTGYVANYIRTTDTTYAREYLMKLLHQAADRGEIKANTNGKNYLLDLKSALGWYSRYKKKRQTPKPNWKRGT